MRRKVLTFAVALTVLLLTVDAAAEGPIRFTKIVTCAADGYTIDLDPGRYLPEQNWITLDTELRRLQDAETRLEAENKVLRKPEPSPWKWVLGAALLGAAGGYYAKQQQGD